MSGASEQNVSDQQDAASGSNASPVDVQLGVADLLSPIDAPDDDDETVDPTFDLDASVRSDSAHQHESFCENWMLQLRSGVLWKDEELNRKASEHIRANNVVKGRPNLTIASFCQWINEELLPNATLAPGFPRRVSIETARCWLHELGFSVM